MQTRQTEIGAEDLQNLACINIHFEHYGKAKSPEQPKYVDQRFHPGTGRAHAETQ